MGLAIFVGLTLMSISLASFFRERAERFYLTYQASLKVTEADKLKYGVDTGVGNILAYGPVKAVEPKSMPEIKGEYSILKRVEEHYQMHTQTYTYSCGKTTCTGIRTYWSWDYWGEDELKTSGYYAFDTKLSNMCEPDTHWLDLDDLYQGGDRHGSDFAYPSSSVRYHWEGANSQLYGSVFLRAFEGSITSPTDKGCVRFYQDKSIEQVVSDSAPHNGITILLLTGLVLVITGVWFWWSYQEDIC